MICIVLILPKMGNYRIIVSWQNCWQHIQHIFLRKSEEKIEDLLSFYYPHTPPTPKKWTKPWVFPSVSFHHPGWFPKPPKGTGSLHGDFSDPRPRTLAAFSLLRMAKITWAPYLGVRYFDSNALLVDLDEGSHGFLGDPYFLNPWDWYNGH